MARDHANHETAIRDPIHGTMYINEAERHIVDSKEVQRLRHVRQLGFADLAFPGATHSRYSHSLGAMFVAGRMADFAFADLDAGRAWLKQCARLAALLHDVGHPPLSHSSERLLPEVAELGLPGWAIAPGQRQATHEDYTVHLLLNSELRRTLDHHFGQDTAVQVASLIAGRLPPGGSPFVRGGIDYFPILRQMVSSECDADRMDYLLRDSFYTGVNYGKYDHDWLCQHVTSHVENGRAFLGIGNRAIFAFENFLLSRYHMFLAVYYHHVPVGFDYMMGRYAEEARGEYVFPSDPDAFASRDDIHFQAALRASSNEWAERLAHRKGYRLLLETTGRDRPVDKERLRQALDQAKAKHFSTVSSGILSKYVGLEPAEPELPIFVVTETLQQVTKLRDYTPLFDHYTESVLVSRIYIEPEAYEKGKALVRQLLASHATTSAR